MSQLNDTMDVDPNLSKFAPEPEKKPEPAKFESKAGGGAGHNGNDDDDNPEDPIVASYPVYINPALPANRRLLVLQQPNRTDGGASSHPSPTELRIKPSHGLVEVDIPIDHASGAYDKEKGLRWGKALQASTTAKSGGSHGLAGGFGFGAVQQRGGGGARRKEVDDDINIDWSEAVRQDKILRTQTLGGQYPVVSDVQYMVGVFQGQNLHLTPANSLVHLRPQLHHIDATTHLDRQSSAKDASGGGAGAGGASGAAGSSQNARAIHMSIKTTSDGDRPSTETMADRMRNVQGEPWRRMRYTDENEEAAWEVYNESLFYKGKTPQEGGGGAAVEGIEGKPELEEGAPTFAVRWGDNEFLEAVSGTKQYDGVDLDADARVEEPSLAPSQPAESSRAPPSGRPRGGAAAGRKGGSARA